MAETSKATIPVFQSRHYVAALGALFVILPSPSLTLFYSPKAFCCSSSRRFDWFSWLLAATASWGPVATVMGLMRLRTTWLEARYLTRSFELQRQTQVLDLAMTVTNYSASSPVSAEIGATINSAWPSPGGSTQWVLAPVIPALGKKDRQ